MNSLRNILLGGILVVTFLLVIEYNKFQERQADLPSPVATQNSSNMQSDTLALPEALPEIEEDTSVLAGNNETGDDLPVFETPQPEQAVSLSKGNGPIEVVTDTLRVHIDPRGGDIVEVALLQHHAELNKPEYPFVLLEKNAARNYTASLNFVVSENGKSKILDAPFRLVSQDLKLDGDQQSLTVDLQLNYQQKLITKRFTFTRGSYLIDVDYLVENRSDATWSAALFGQIVRDSYVPGKSNAFAMNSFTGYALSTHDTNYKKFNVADDIERDTFESVIQDRWIAFVQHYFVSAWIPEKGIDVSYKLKKLPSGLNRGSFTPSKLFTVAPGSRAETGAHFYAGPKDIRELQKLAPHLDKTVDYGFLWFIAKPLFYAMDNIHSYVGNWGIAIILLTLAIKAVFFYPSAISYRSMAKMRKVQPLMAELKERYGEDRQRMSQELMKLYKREKVNPMSGCLPILMQMPVFLALYWMIMESVELRHAPFYLWIHDLSMKDPYFILPLLMGASMFIQQKLNPAPPDPMQAKIMQMLPIFFTFLFLFFPSGLVLYWVVNNTLSILQQYVITKQIEKSG